MINRTAGVWVSLLVLTAGCSVPASMPRSDASVQLVENAPFSYKPYGEVLKQHVDRNGRVDYSGLQANRDLLDQFNRSMGAVSPETYGQWSDAEKIAFLINAYNAFTLQSIIDQTPLKASIRDIPGVWRVRQFDIAGERKTLDAIEHQTLRTDFNEPRIHMALVCAAVSCPVLRTEPYTGENLNVQLEDQVNRFLNSPQGFRLDQAEKTVYLSSIFQWFGEDWTASYTPESGFVGNEAERAVLNFISQYLEEGDRAYLLNGEYTIVYLDYDWSLNNQ